MQKIVNQIRELDLIEKELNDNPVGVLAINNEDEKVTQLATTFLYLDKNIYLFFSNDDEVFENIQFDSNCSFTVIKYGKGKKDKKYKFEPTYNLFSISVTGVIKKVDDNKTIEELRNNFAKKYKKDISGDIDFSLANQIVLLDSEEIQAFEETGG